MGAVQFLRGFGVGVIGAPLLHALARSVCVCTHKHMYVLWVSEQQTSKQCICIYKRVYVYRQNTKYVCR